MNINSFRIVYRLCITCVLLLATVVGCKTNDLGILSKSPCAPPCWENLVPGTKHSANEIVDLISRRYRPTEIGIYTEEIKTWVKWEGDSDPWADYTTNAIILSDRINGNIEYIYISIPYTLTVKQLIDVYGPPDCYLTQKRYHPSTTMNPYYTVAFLEYAHKGYHYEAYLGDGSIPILEAQIIQAIYVEPDSMFDSFAKSNLCKRWDEVAP